MRTSRLLSPLILASQISYVVTRAVGQQFFHLVLVSSGVLSFLLWGPGTSRERKRRISTSWWMWIPLILSTHLLFLGGRLFSFPPSYFLVDFLYDDNSNWLEAISRINLGEPTWGYGAPFLLVMILANGISRLISLDLGSDLESGQPLLALGLIEAHLLILASFTIFIVWLIIREFGASRLHSLMLASMIAFALLGALSQALFHGHLTAAYAASGLTLQFSRLAVSRTDEEVLLNCLSLAMICSFWFPLEPFALLLVLGLLFASYTRRVGTKAFKFRLWGTGLLVLAYIILKNVHRLDFTRTRGNYLDLLGRDGGVLPLSKTQSLALCSLVFISVSLLILRKIAPRQFCWPLMCFGVYCVSVAFVDFFRSGTLGYGSMKLLWVAGTPLCIAYSIHLLGQISLWSWARQSVRATVLVAATLGLTAYSLSATHLNVTIRALGPDPRPGFAAESLRDQVQLETLPPWDEQWFGSSWFESERSVRSLPRACVNVRVRNGRDFELAGPSLTTYQCNRIFVGLTRPFDQMQDLEYPNTFLKLSRGLVNPGRIIDEASLDREVVQSRVILLDDAGRVLAEMRALDFFTAYFFGS